MSKKHVLQIASLMLAIVMLFAVVLTGCGKEKANVDQTDSSSAGGKTDNSSTEKPVVNETEKFVKLTWYMPPPINSPPNEKNVMAEVNKYLKEKINAELEFQFVDYGSFDEKMKVMSAAGDPYDLTFCASWINMINLNVSRGAFLELDGLLEKYGPNVIKTIEERWWPAVTYNGKKYAIPNPSNYAQSWGFVYRKDLVEKYGFDYKNVHTLEQLEPYLEIIKKNEPDVIPLCATTVNTPAMDTALEVDHVVANIYYDPQAGKFLPIYDIQRMVDKYKLLSEFYKKGYIAKDAGTKNDYQAESKTGRYAVMSTGGAYSEDGAKSTGMYGFPCVESYIGTTLVTTNSVTSACTAISRTSENPERAMMLLDLIYADKKFLNLLGFGIEGQDYKVVDGAGTDTPTVEANSPFTWAIWHNWIGNLYDQYPCVNGNTAKDLAMMKKAIDESDASPILGFIFDTEPVKNECAQLQAINSEYSSVLVTGTNPNVDAYLEEFRKKCEAAGINKVIAEIERQYNEWKAANAK